jgi:Domain of unknown function (DUF4440)
MRIAIPCCMLLSACTIIPAAPDSGASLSAVKAIEQQRLSLMLAADVVPLRALLSNQLTYCHSTGICESGGSLLTRLGSGELKYLKLEPLDLQADPVAGTVVLHGTLNMAVQTAAQPMAMRLRYLAVYEKTAGRWQLRAYQSTRMP